MIVVSQKYKCQRMLSRRGPRCGTPLEVEVGYELRTDPEYPLGEAVWIRLRCPKCEAYRGGLLEEAEKHIDEIAERVGVPYG